MKKARALFKLYYKGETSYSQTWPERIVSVGSVVMLLAIFWIFHNSFYSWLVYLLLCCSGISSKAAALREPGIRILPVTDRYLVGSILFVWPAALTGICLLLVSLAGVLVKASAAGSAAPGYRWYLLWKLGTHPVFWIFYMLLIAFRFSSFAVEFSAVPRERIAGEIINVAMIGGAFYAGSRINLSLGTGIYDETAVASQTTVDGCILVFLLVVFLWLCVSGIAAYRRGLHYLRYGHNGTGISDHAADSGDDDASSDRNSELAPAITLSVILIGILIIIIAIWAVLLDFGKSEQIEQTCTEASQYEEWDTITAIEDIMYQNIFPDRIDVNEAEAYYSQILGEEGGDDGVSWSSGSAVRYLKMSYTEEQYASEKARISEFKVTADEEQYKGEAYYQKSQTFIRDSEHFPGEAYIAVWEPEEKHYEFAMFDDDAQTVTYVCSSGMALSEIKADDPVFEGDEDTVLSKEEQNLKDGGYSVYIFKDGLFQASVEP